MLRERLTFDSLDVGDRVVLFEASGLYQDILGVKNGMKGWIAKLVGSGYRVKFDSGPIAHVGRPYLTRAL